MSNVSEVSEEEDATPMETTPPAEMDPARRAALFTEAFRALEITTEKRVIVRSLSFDSDDGAMTVLAEDDNDSDLSGFDTTFATDAEDGIAPGFELVSEEELHLLWRQLQQRELPNAKVARNLIVQMREHLRTECSALVHIPRPAGRLVVIGDLHGHISDFWHVYLWHGHPGPKNIYLFNGDFVDRGIWGPEVVLAIFVLRLMCPKYVFLNRGNHESEMCTRFYGFQTHLACAYPDNHKELYSLIHTAFNQLPLCHVIDRRVFVTHAGLPDFTPSLEQIEALQRGPLPTSAKTAEEKLFVALLWSDPRSMSAPSDRGIGWHFSAQLTFRFLQKNNLEYIVRSHECVDAGFQETHSGFVKTVFSASNYDATNNANVALIDSDLKLTSGDMWNEVYIKPEWVEGVESDVPEFDLEAIEQAGGSFTEIECEISKGEGQLFGVRLNADDPILQIPIVVAIDSGLLLSHNNTYPDTAVQVGDAILDINGRFGYQNIKEALATGGKLCFRFRRPQTLHVKLTAAEVSRLPPASDLCFPISGFVFGHDKWGPLAQADRILEVNGKRQGEEMKEMMTKEGQDLDMVLLRYAPEDFIPARPGEKLAEQLRQRVVEEWDGAGAQKLAIDAVRNRLGKLAMVGDQEERVLSQVHRLIYLNRATLLEKFQYLDTKAHSRQSFDSAGSTVRNWRGTVTREQWSQVLRSTLETGAGFPWPGLRPFLCTLQDKSGRVEYVPFLLRYQNPVSRWLLKGWCVTALDQIAYECKGEVLEVFERLDYEGLGKLDFGTMRKFITGHVFRQATNQVEQDYQSLFAFALFRQINGGSRTASVTRADFRSAFMGRKTTTSKVSPTGRVLQWQQMGLCCQEAYDCDDCGREIMDLTWASWERDDFDLCRACIGAREANDNAVFAGAQKADQMLELQWARVRRLLEVLSSSLLTVEDLFRNPNGYIEVIDRENFQAAIGDIFQDDIEAAEEVFKSVCLYLQDQGKAEDGTFSLKDLTDCMKVQDSKSESNLQET